MTNNNLKICYFMFSSNDNLFHINFCIFADPIKINITPSQTQLNANQKEDLTCSFSGVPPPTVKWYHVTYNGLRELITSGVTTGAQQSVLHLDSVGALSAGQYICEVANGFENKSVSSSLNVICKLYHAVD